MGETGAAACTTTGKNLAAVGSGHSLAEAVLFGALKLLGLIGARSSHFVFTSLKNLPAARAGCTYSTAGGDLSPQTAVDINQRQLSCDARAIISVSAHKVNRKFAFFSHSGLFRKFLYREKKSRTISCAAGGPAAQALPKENSVYIRISIACFAGGFLVYCKE